MKLLIFSLLFAFPPTLVPAQTAGEASGSCLINRHGNAPESAQKLISRYSRSHKEATTASWTGIDARLIQAATRKAYGTQALVGRTDDGRPCLLFFPAGAGFTPLPHEKVEEVYIVAAPLPASESGTTIDAGRMRPFVDVPTAHRYMAAYTPGPDDPYRGFIIQPGLINSMAAIPEIQSMRIYLCDDPEARKGDAAGILFVGVLGDGTELWGARSFFQDGSTLVPQQCPARREK